VSWIDGLRGLAVLIVLLYHHWGFAGFPPMKIGPLNVADLLENGIHGIHLFFVISGFCLAWPFSGPEGKTLSQFKLGAFFRQRFRRLAPGYYAALVLSAIPVFAAVLFKTGDVPGELWEDLLMHGLFIHNLNIEYASGFNMALWTIALQFQFYLLFPLFLWLLFRTGPAGLALVVMGLELMYRSFIWASISDDWHLNYFFAYAPPGRMFEFAAGMVIASLIRSSVWQFDSGKIRWGAMAMVLLPGTLAWQISRDPGRLHPAVDVLWAFCIGGLMLLGFSAALWRRVLESRILRFCGVCSYSVFLVHHPVGSWLYHHFYFEEEISISLRLLVMNVYVPLMFSAGWIFYRWFEKPFLKPKAA